MLPLEFTSQRAYENFRKRHLRDIAVAVAVAVIVGVLTIIRIVF